MALATASVLRCALAASSASFREWRVTPSANVGNAGGALTLTVSMITGGVSPPEEPQTLTLDVFRDNGSSLVRSYALTPGVASQNVTLDLTATGAVGGAANIGTLRTRIRAQRTTGAPTSQYDMNSDAGNFGSPGNTPPNLYNIPVADWGWLRSDPTGNLVEALSNLSLGGAKTQPAVFGESLFARLTSPQASYTARVLSVAVSDTTPPLSANTNSTTSATRDVTFTGVVDDRFPAAVTAVGVVATVPNAALTGAPDWVYRGATDDSINVDSRRFCAHHLQINDNSFGTPPLIKLDADGRRRATEIGYISTNIRDARGTLIGSAITRGMNGLTVFTSFQDALGQLSAQTQSQATGTVGGEAGWVTAFMQWVASLPSGGWTKTVSITAPANAVSTAHLVNRTINYTLIATNPDYRVSLMLGSSRPGTHFIVGSTLEADVQLFDTVTGKAIEPDAVEVAIRRINSSDRAQHITVGSGWVDSYNGAIPPEPVGGEKLPASQLSADQWIYRVAIVSDDTWTNDFEVVAFVLKDFITYPSDRQREVVSKENPHDENEFDPTGLFK